MYYQVNIHYVFISDCVSNMPDSLLARYVNNFYCYVNLTFSVSSHCHNWMVYTMYTCLNCEVVNLMAELSFTKSHSLVGTLTKLL